MCLQSSTEAGPWDSDNRGSRLPSARSCAQSLWKGFGGGLDGDDVVVAARTLPSPCTTTTLVQQMPPRSHGNIVCTFGIFADQKVGFTPVHTPFFCIFVHFSGKKTPCPTGRIFFEKPPCLAIFQTFWATIPNPKQYRKLFCSSLDAIGSIFQAIPRRRDEIPSKIERNFPGYYLTGFSIPKRQKLKQNCAITAHEHFSKVNMTKLSIRST